MAILCRQQQADVLRSSSKVTDFNQIWPFSIFIKPANTKFQGDPSSGSRADACGETDGHDVGDRHFSPLCERA
jgi:hypothetical protein